MEETSKKILLTSLSAAVAETAFFPIDIIKTRLQIHSSFSSPSSVQKICTQLWKEGKFMGFYRGVSPAIVRHLFYSPIRIVGYEKIRDCSGDFVIGKAFAGGASGVFAQIIASPADLIKVRMQADGCLLSQGLQPRYSGIFDAFSKIIKTEGIKGLWRGVVPNAQRAFLVNMGELTCYDQAKHFVINKQICGDNIYAHTLASICSGLSATTLSCPADVIKTRMMNQHRYKSSYDCLVKTVKFEGVMAMWKGFLPTWARLGPWQFVFWVSYEKFRKISGLSSF